MSTTFVHLRQSIFSFLHSFLHKSVRLRTTAVVVLCSILMAWPHRCAAQSPPDNFTLTSVSSTTPGLLQMQTGAVPARQDYLSSDLVNQPPGDYLIQAFDAPTGVPNSSFQLLAGSSVTAVIYMYQPTGDLGNLFPEVKLFLNGPTGIPICSVTGSTALKSTMNGMDTIQLTCAPASNVVLTPNDRYYLWVGVQSTGTPSISTQADIAVGSVQRGFGWATLWLPLPVPHFSNITPSNGPPGTALTISGNTFGAAQGSVTINGEPLTITAWSDTSISAVLPADATTGNIVITTTGGAQSNGWFFFVSPVISSISPTIGPAGSQVTITGTNFGLPQGELFIGQQDLSIVSWTDTSVVATIPLGAVTDNIILETNHLLYSNAVGFTVLTPPQIAASASPAPNGSGWNTTNVTVTFTCTGGSLPIASCPVSQIVSSEGANQVISGTVIDSGGNSATASITLNIDKTGPVISVTSPAEGATVSSANITVTGTLSDPASGPSGITCNGTAGTVDNGSFSCNISFNPGVNVIKVRATDIAGNNSGVNAHASLTAALPLPVSLQVTPAKLNVLIGEIQTLVAIDEQGRQRPDAAWTVSDASVANLTDSSAGNITGVSAGEVTVTATIQNVFGQATVDVFSGASLPLGVPSWSQPPLTGNQILKIVQSIGVSTPSDVYVVESSSGSSTLRALRGKGKQLWATSVPNPQGGESINVVPASNGGILLDYPFSRKVIDLDGETGQPIWEYDPASVDNGREIALGQDGTVYLREQKFVPDSNFQGTTDQIWSLIAIDGNTGNPSTLYTVPSSTRIESSSCDGSTFTIPQNTSQLSNPAVAPDGAVLAETNVHHDTDLFNCSGSAGSVPGVTLSVLRVAPDGTNSLTPFHTVTANDGSDKFPSISEVIPDDSGGQFAAWSSVSKSETHVVHIFGGGLTDFQMPFGGNGVKMMLGDQSMLFATDGGSLAASTQNGTPVWSWNTGQDHVELAAAVAGGGLIGQYDTAQGSVAIQFDVAGNSSNDASVAAVSGGLFNLSLGESGNAYFGAASSSLISELGANVEFAPEPWSAPKQKRKRQAEVGLRLVGDTDCSHAAAFDNDTVWRGLAYLLRDGNNNPPIDKNNHAINYTVFEYQPDQPSVAGCKDIYGAFTGISPCQYADGSVQFPYNTFEDVIALFPGWKSNGAAKQLFFYGLPNQRRDRVNQIYRTTAVGLKKTDHYWLTLATPLGAEPTIDGHVGPYMGRSKTFDGGIIGICTGTNQLPPN